MHKILAHSFCYGTLAVGLILGWHVHLIKGDQLKELESDNHSLREQLQFSLSMQRGYEARFTEAWKTYRKEHGLDLSPPQPDTAQPDTAENPPTVSFSWHKGGAQE